MFGNSHTSYLLNVFKANGVAGLSAALTVMVLGDLGGRIIARLSNDHLCLLCPCSKCLDRVKARRLKNCDNLVVLNGTTDL